MRGRPTDFWGKLDQDKDGNVLGWHPLADHCADVAAVCEALLERTLLRRRLARLADLEDLSETQVARLCVLAALHDAGKFNHGFQNKAFGHRDVAGHQIELLAVLNPNNGYGELTRRLLTALSAHELGDWGSHPDGDDVFQLLVATVSHHGRPIRIDQKERIVPRHWQPAHGLDPCAGIADLVTRTREWFPDAWQPGGDALPAAPAFQHGWVGLLILADWLGSDDAPDRFPFRQDGDGGDRMEFARRRALHLLERLGIDAGPARRSLGREVPGFRTVVPEGDPWAPAYGARHH